MKIAGTYSFAKGREIVEKHYTKEYQEIKKVIASINEEEHKTKESDEKTKKGEMLYSPRSLNNAFKKGFAEFSDWGPVRVESEYSVSYYEKGFNPKAMNKGGFREMDFVKNKLGVEVQFGKYAFMVYNVCAKMTIFKNLNHIKAGIEIVPMKQFVEHMSSGVSFFEQFVWDLEKRGVSNIDTPVLILGIAADWEKNPQQKLPEMLVQTSEKVIPNIIKTGNKGSKPGPKK